MRDHSPLVIEEFNGLWKRGDPNNEGVDKDSCPQDHFTACNNIRFVQGGFATRDGIEPFLPYGNVVRIYNYSGVAGESLLILDTSGNIFHSESPTPSVAILTIAGMADFCFVTYSGRAYISPTNLPNEFLYVYKGDGTPARRSGGTKPSIAGKVAFTAYNTESAGLITKGIHIIAVSYNGTSGLGPEVFPIVIAPGKKEIKLDNIPVSAGKTRTIAMTKAIDPKDYVANQTTYTYYQALVIANDTDTNAIISIADADLVTILPVAGAGAPVSGALLASNSSQNGNSDQGFRLIGVVYETDTGFLTSIGPESFASVCTINQTKRIDIGNIPVSPNSYVEARWLVSTKVIQDYNGNQEGYQFFFIPNGRIPDNTSTTTNVSFFDADLLDDASHLFDLYENPPSCGNLATYHGRLVEVGGTGTGLGHSSIDEIRVSVVGEPEAINQIDGILRVPEDSRGLTAAQEYRDVLYVFKSTKTFAINDNGDLPVNWPITLIDQGQGCNGGVARTLNSDGLTVESLLVPNFSGLCLFNGTFVKPELTWKIEDLWQGTNRVNANRIQVMNDTILKRIYLNLPDWTMLMGDYSNGLDPKNIRWTPWTFDVQVSTIALLDFNKLIIGSVGIRS
jgi:hypothetical protein